MIASVCVHSHCSCTQAFILESSWIDIPVGSLAHLVHQRHELRPRCCVKQKPLKADGQTKLTCMVGGLTFNHPADHWVWISFESSRSTTIKVIMQRMQRHTQASMTWCFPRQFLTAKKSSKRTIKTFRDFIQRPARKKKKSSRFLLYVSHPKTKNNIYIHTYK